MSEELLYTSAPKGLLPGSTGYCTVAMTREMSLALREKLESLSAYRAPLGPAGVNAANKQVVYSTLLAQRQRASPNGVEN